MKVQTWNSTKRKIAPKMARVLVPGKIKGNQDSPPGLHPSGLRTVKHLCGTGLDQWGLLIILTHASIILIGHFPQEIPTVHKAASYNIFLHAAPKAQATKEKLDKLDFTKIKKLSCFKEHNQESEKKTHRKRENICKSHLIRNLYPEYIKNSYNSIMRR